MSEQMIVMLSEALAMFAFLGVELALLFLVISFTVGVIQDYLPASKIQSILSSKDGRGYVSAAILGGITPFCSCSTIPMLSGFLKARAGFGPTITFLLTSPLLNPIIIALFLATFGIDVTVMYAVVALTVSIVSAYVLEKLGFDRYIRPEILQNDVNGGCDASKENISKRESSSSSCNIPPSQVSTCEGSTEEGIGIVACCDGTILFTEVKENKWLRIWNDTWKQFKAVLPYLLIGISIGAFTYGFLPSDLIVKYAGPDNPFAVPIAAIIGVPLYIRAEAVIPLSSALAAKGMGMGAVMALIIGSAGASLTEVILLKSMFMKQMIIAFLSVIFGMAILAGLMFNLIF
jgi:uncharacterized membrane protein YraQ (UPF0718 family)